MMSTTSEGKVHVHEQNIASREAAKNAKLAARRPKRPALLPEWQSRVLPCTGWAQVFMRKWLISRISRTEKRKQELTAKSQRQGASALPPSLHPMKNMIGMATKERTGHKAYDGATASILRKVEQ